MAENAVNDTGIKHIWDKGMELIESTQSVSGNPVTIANAAPINAEDITVDITPQQDLHGYDRPWAGGAGKNKCPINDIDVWADTKDAITDKIPIGNQKTYTISMIIERIDGVTISNNALYPVTIQTYDSNDTQVDSISEVITLASGSTTFQKSFTVSNNASYMIVNLRNRNGDNHKNTHKYNVQLEEGSTPTTFAPYSNICPIEEWTGAELDRVGKNWFDGTFPDIVPQNVTYRSIAVPNGTYTVSSSCPLNSGQGANIFFLAGNVQTGAGTNINGVWVGQNRTVTTTNGYVTIAYRLDGGIDPRNYSTQIELGTQPTTYEPYQGQQYTQSFGETVHGGKWHVTEGGTDKTHANIANYNGETINEPWLSSLDEYSPGATPTTGAQVVYPLTTPTTISIPKQNVPMLKGINTVYADCGDVSLRYQPDNVIGEIKGEIRAVEAELAKAEENLKIVYEDYVANTNMGIVVQDQAVGDVVYSDALDITKTGYTPIAVTDTSVVLSTVADQGKIATHCLLDATNNRVRFYVHCMDSTASVAIPPNSLTFRVAYKKA